MNASCYVLLPIVVIFCVRKEDKDKQKNTQPPRSLQFHNGTPDPENPSNPDNCDHQNQDREIQQVAVQIHALNN